MVDSMATEHGEVLEAPTTIIVPTKWGGWGCSKDVQASTKSRFERMEKVMAHIMEKL